MKTRNATKAAAEAVEGVRSRVASYDAAFEISRAAASLQETQRHIKNGAWGSAVDSYINARAALLRLSNLSIALTDVHREEIAVSLSDITSWCDRTENSIQRGKINIDAAKSMSAARGHADLISRLSIVIEKAAQ